MSVPFLLFEGDDYYPQGGWLDYAGAFETLEAAQAAKSERKYEGGWAHVVDSRSGVVVSFKDRRGPWHAERLVLEW